MPQVNQNINQNMYNQQLYMQQQAQQNQPAKRPVQTPAQTPAQQPVKIPSYYYVPENSLNGKSVKEVIKEYDMMGVVTPFIEHPLMVLGTWLGLSLGIDSYAKACGGKYEDSLVKKAANLGDSIQNSKAIQNKPVQSVLKGITSVKNKFSKTVQNNSVLRAMRDTPSMPEWSMVRSQMFDQRQEVVQDFVKIVDELNLDKPDKIKLKNIGITAKEKEALKKTFNVKKLSEIPEEKVVSQVLLERIGRTPEQIKKIQALGQDKAMSATKNELLKEMGMTVEKLKNIREDVFGKYVNDVMTATKKAGSRIRIGAGHYGWMGPLTKPFERTVGCDEVYNKLFSLVKDGAKVKGGAKTATGVFMSKAMQTMHRGITWGNGKLGALLFIAPLLVEVASNVKKADKDQKVGTAIGGVVESCSWVLTFPLGLRMMHSLGGAQYAGMSQDQVKAFRDAQLKFNEKAKTGIFKNKEEYNKAKQAVKDMLKVKDQGIFTKGVRKLAQFMTMDLETFKGYKNSNAVMNFARKVPNFFKNVAGVPMRFAIWGLITMGLLDGTIKKCTTAIFGKSYDAMKQDENENARKEQKKFLAEDLNRRLYEAQRVKQYGKQPQPTQPAQKGQMMSARGKVPNSAAIPQVYPEDEKVDNYTYIPSSKNIIPHKAKNNGVDTYTYIPSSDCKIPNDAKTDEKQRRYIPSQAAANIQKNFDNSGLQSALDRAQKAEDKALRVLAGNFDGM